MMLLSTQHIRGNDYSAKYICEFCESVEDGHLYNDANFYNNVIPNKKCKTCGSSTLHWEKKNE